MLAVFCLLLLPLLDVGFCQDSDLPSRLEIENSINRTIEEVERQIRQDPALPRLTRQEIVKFLRNVTSQHLNELKDNEKLERARDLYRRALMVVLPYNGGESPGNLKELYAKAPMTRIIADSENDEDKLEGERRDKGENLIPSDDSYEESVKESTTVDKSGYKNHRETYSEVRSKIPLKETLKLDSTPVRFTFDLENLRKNAYTTTTEETATTVGYPIYKSDETAHSQLEIVYSTSVTDQPTTESSSKRIAVLHSERPKTNENVLTSSEWRYNAPPTFPSDLREITFLPTVNAHSDPPLPVPSTKQQQIFVTPMPTGASSKVKYSSTYSLNSAGFRQAIGTAATTTTTTTTVSSTAASTPMRAEVMDLLASIGLRPDNSGNVEDVYKRNKEMTEKKAVAASIVGRNTFEHPTSEMKKGVENLTPDIRLLFQRFGLESTNLDQPSSKVAATVPTQPTALDSHSYTNFKPLPTSVVKDREMKEFLAKFGLGGSDDRRKKSMKWRTTEAPSLVEAVPNNMRGILENIGLISNAGKASKTVVYSTEDMESTETSKFHVFKPHEATVKDEEQRNKINELLDTVKLVQEGKADVRSVKKVANELLESGKVLKEGPDPLKLEEIVKNFNEHARNEVKRQEEQQRQTTTASTMEKKTNSSSTPATESAETTLSVPTTADSTGESNSSRSATTEADGSSSTTASNLMALEESFGGTTQQPDAALPPRRKSGLYFLVDWNTFLEVGEEDKEKINLRFQPKVGDRTRFLPVTVP